MFKEFGNWKGDPFTCCKYLNHWLRFQFSLLKVSPPDIHSQTDFPTLTPYSADKKNKWKFKVVPKSAWKRIEKNTQKTYGEQSETKTYKHLIKKIQNIQDEGIIEDTLAWKNSLSNENLKSKNSKHKYEVISPGVSIFLNINSPFVTWFCFIGVLP